MRVFVLNSGSASIKFKILQLPEKGDRVETEARSLVQGELKGIGGLATLELRTKECAPCLLEGSIRDHEEGVKWLFESLGAVDAGLLRSVEAVGLRVLHGGAVVPNAMIIDDNLLAEITRLSALTPLHTPGLRAALRYARSDLRQDIPVVAVFDTAFAHALPPRAQTYAIPQDLAARHGIRRFGFHGTAHASVMEKYCAMTESRSKDIRLISLHLGSGCSAAAIQGDRCVDTSMGFTPLEGLVMGTRCGDMDPAIVSYLARLEGVSADEVVGWLNERSGLRGMSNRSSEMRELLDAARADHDAQAILAIDVFCYRAKKYIGAYLAALNGANALLFSGGIGENSPEIRQRICEGMSWCQLDLDTAKNEAVVGRQPTDVTRISREGSQLEVFVVAADEETWIAHETAAVIANRRGGSRP